ncbi:MAG: hypothetical protein CMJ37_02080 [Phycisphaerae bacterium]|nr:hypothetical protein [Phycisphaerae bacterium]
MGLTFLKTIIQFTTADWAVPHHCLYQKQFEYVTPVILKPNVAHKMRQSNRIDQKLLTPEDHS